MPYQFESIPLSRVNVDEANFRIGDQDTRRDAYRAMIEEQGTDLVNLADDIVQNGLSPAERFIVSPDQNEAGSYIANEGNRRVTALKLMENPDLAAGTSVEKAFKRLSPDYLKNPISKLDCVVMADKEAALLWSERKHRPLNGRGLSQWDAPAQARAEAYRGRVRPSKAVLEHLRAKGLLSAEIDKRVSGFTTNLDRVFQMPYLLARLGIDIRRDGTIHFDGGKEPAGAKLLLDMIRAMAVKGFNVNKIRHLPDREAFIDGFADRTLIEARSKGNDAANSGSGGTGNGAHAKSRRRQPSSLTRRSLALGGRTNALAISETRLNSLYGEALIITADRLPNSSGILMRVFLELSAEHYIDVFKLPLPGRHLKKGKTNWSDNQISLKEKIVCVLHDLDPSDRKAEFAEARRGLSGDEYLHSINTLHQYVHNLKMDAEGKEMKRAWDRWHPFLMRLFDAINNRNP
jgi:hypothetical protein